MLLNMTYSLLLGNLLISLLQPVFLVVVVVAFIVVLVQYRHVRMRIRQDADMMRSSYEMMNSALKVASNNVIIYDLRTSVIHQTSGKMLLAENVTVEEFKQHVHPDDLDTVVNSIRQLRLGQQQQSDFAYRWNFNGPGEEPQWAFLRNTSVAEHDEFSSEITSIVSVLVDETDLHQQQKEEEELSQKYKKIFEDSIIGLSFYTPDGWLIDANKMMRQICHFDSEEADAFFSTTNLFELFPFNEIFANRQPYEYWACSLSIIPERDMRVYLEIGVHPIYDKDGNLVYISIATRDVSAEREMYLQANHNDAEIQKVNESIQVYEQELRYMMETCGIQAWRITLERDVIEFYNGLSSVDIHFTLEQLRSIFVNQDDKFVQALVNPAEAISKPLSYMGQMHPVVSRKQTEPQWVQINSIPEYDEHGQLKGAFGIWRNINNLMKKQEELKRETERANDSGRMKSVFIANMTHEIRTPLNAIVGFSDVLPMLTNQEERQEMLRLIMDNCDMLMRLVNDIQAAASLDVKGGVQITPVKIDFSKFFDEISESMAHRVQAPGVEFIKENPYTTYVTTVDEAHIRQVCTNFVTNAVKYTQQGHIKLGYRKEWREENGGNREGLYIYCEDTGNGIPKESQSKVFDRFFKLNDYIQGTGLGLSICKAIADACHGFIGVDSEGENQGSTFWLWIPCEEIKI